MKELVCKMCNSNEIIKNDDFYICESCGTKYALDEADKLSVEVVVKNDNSEKISALIKAANRAKKMGNWDSAAKYYDEILGLDPDNWEAVFYSAYCTARNCKIAQIASACQLVINSYRPTFKILKEKLDPINQEVALSLMAFDVCEIAELMQSASVNHYIGIGESIRSNYIGELRTRCTISACIALDFGDYIKEFFGNKYTSPKIMAYKKGLALYDCGNCNIKSTYIDSVVEIIRVQDSDYIAKRQQRIDAALASKRTYDLTCAIVILIFGIGILIASVTALRDIDGFNWGFGIAGALTAIVGLVKGIKAFQIKNRK